MLFRSPSIGYEWMGMGWCLSAGQSLGSFRVAHSADPISMDPIIRCILSSFAPDPMQNYNSILEGHPAITRKTVAGESGRAWGRERGEIAGGAGR